MSRAFSDPSPTPQPGEIWGLSEQPDRYVLIIRDHPLEALPEVITEETCSTFTVMPLSPEISSLSDIDILLPTPISGLPQALLAETWHIIPILSRSLQARHGNRISRAIYDCLMTIGDAHQDNRIRPLSSTAIQSLGLTIAAPLTHQQPHIQAFHQREIAWSNTLRLPYQTYQNHIRSLQWADRAIRQTAQVEQILQQSVLPPIPSRPIPLNPTILSQWLQNQFAAEWQAIEQLITAGTLHLTTATRATEPDAPTPEIAQLLPQLSPNFPEPQRRSAAKQLATIGQGNPTVIQALIELLRSPQETEDELLWTAIESLWQVDPGNPIAGVRRVRLLDLGLQVAGHAVALAIAIVRRPDQRFGIMLRLYPTTNEPYLPENLQLILLDEASEPHEVTARRNDLYIQLKFNGVTGERFSVQVRLGDTQITEEFLL